MAGYTMESDPDTSAKAIGRDIPISPKFSREVCGMIRGMKVEAAMKALEDVIDLKRAVPLKRYKKRVSHKKGTGPGRYPVKAAEAILRVIQSAVSNAEYKGLDEDNMFVATISASRDRPYTGACPTQLGEPPSGPGDGQPRGNTRGESKYGIRKEIHSREHTQGLSRILMKRSAAPASAAGRQRDAHGNQYNTDHGAPGLSSKKDRR